MCLSPGGSSSSGAFPPLFHAPESRLSASPVFLLVFDWAPLLLQHQRFSTFCSFFYVWFTVLGAYSIRCTPSRVDRISPPGSPLTCGLAWLFPFFPCWRPSCRSGVPRRSLRNFVARPAPCLNAFSFCYLLFLAPGRAPRTAVPLWRVSARTVCRRRFHTRPGPFPDPPGFCVWTAHFSA